MHKLVVIGLILSFLGLAGFFVPRVSFTQQETVIDPGPVQVEAERERSVPVPVQSTAEDFVAALFPPKGLEVNASTTNPTDITTITARTHVGR